MSCDPADECGHKCLGCLRTWCREARPSPWPDLCGDCYETEDDNGGKDE